MGKIYFYCHNTRCGRGRQVLEKVAEELDGKKLCRVCYDKGLRLKRGIVVFRFVPREGLKEVEG